MATELIATGFTAANSADITLADGESATVGMKGGTAFSVIKIELKDDDGGYNTVGDLNSQRPAVSINAAGTYRLRRLAGDANSACGAYRG